MQQVLKIFLFIAISSAYQQLNAQSSKIKVNQIGYLKAHSKIAWLSNSNASLGASWYVKDASSGQALFTSSLTQSPAYDAASGDTLFKMDFTTLDSSGTYYIEVDNVGTSYNFVISDTTYNNLFRDLVRSYYYQRCGYDLTDTYAGIWNRTACHTNDGYIYNGYSGGSIIKGAYVASTGGWHDAGDYGKKVTPASFALYHMLKLIELFPATLSNVPLNLPPDSFAMPDLLKEAKFELDLFLKLQFSDGSVSHLITEPNFAEKAMPEQDTQTRYIVPASSLATADFAAVMAIAAKVYKPYNTSYASQCLSAAKNAWAYLQTNPFIAPTGGYTADPPGINKTGQYLDTSDRDERLWASAELFNTTSDTSYKSFFEKHYSYWNPELDYPDSWVDVHNCAMFTYCFATSKETGNTIRTAIINNIKYYAGLIVSEVNSTGYGTALRPSDYYWGSNQLVGSYGVDLIRAYFLNPDTTYLEAALSHLSYILGNNPMNLCYVTGQGTNSTQDPLQVPSIYDGITAPVPGFLAGGPNQYSDPYDVILNNYISANHPASAKCYVDNHGSYAGNEVCVTYTAPALFLAGYFYNPNSSGVTGIVNSTSANTINLSVYPNPNKGAFTLSFTSPDTYSYTIFNSIGTSIDKGTVEGMQGTVNIQNNTPGIYLLQISSKNSTVTRKIILE